MSNGVGTLSGAVRGDGRHGGLAQDASCLLRVCSHSIGRELSRKLALVTMGTLSVLFAVTWMAVGAMIGERNALDLRSRCGLIAEMVELEARAGGEGAVLARLRADAMMRGSSHLELRRADGSLFYRDSGEPPPSRHTRVDRFTIESDVLAGGPLQGVYAVDFSRDAAIGQRWAALLVALTLLAGAAVSIGARWHVRRALRPLGDLAAQTRAISADSLDQRLALADPAEELLPWIEQFNALMQRLERAYAQLEGFNADVAHELRTPLAALIGQTEVALSRERSAESLRETLASNLEELQRLSALVNDMLFLSHADRGAMARRGEPVSLAALTHQVAEFHEATLEEAGLHLQVQGDAQARVDVPLFKRALSNLIGNATRFAAPGTTVQVRITPLAPAALPGAAPGVQPGGPTQVQVVVQNQGQGIAPAQLPRLFDRFFRAEASRSCPDEVHHGLGLAIVAAIARMHAGHTVAESEGGVTRVGFTLGLR
jgi:two-component system, OmpR family, heavy metal sensor histidine kinase CusS